MIEGWEREQKMKWKITQVRSASKTETAMGKALCLKGKGSSSQYRQEAVCEIK